MSIQRDRGWRQCVNRKNKHQEMGCSRVMFKPEKKWSNLYTRSLKMTRATQLGIEYPRISRSQRRLNALSDSE